MRPIPKNFESDEYISKFYISEANFHEVNHSERGPNGLLQPKIDGTHCVGHGKGTWDYMIGNFS